MTLSIEIKWDICSSLQLLTIEHIMVHMNILPLVLCPIILHTMQNNSLQGGPKTSVVENQDLVSVSRMPHHQRSWHKTIPRSWHPNQRLWHETIQRTSQPIKGHDTKTTRGVSCCGLAIYIKKNLKAKQELWKFKYFTMQKYNLKQNPLNKPKSFKIS